MNMDSSDDEMRCYLLNHPSLSLHVCLKSEFMTLIINSRGLRAPANYTYASAIRVTMLKPARRKEAKKKK